MTWEYIAGFFDGEGWVTRYPKPEGCLAKYVCGMAQATYQGQVIYDIAAFLKVKGVKCHVRSDHTNNRTTSMVRLSISDCSSLVGFMKGVLPHLLVKHEKSAACLEASSQCLKRIQERKDRVNRATEMRLAGTPFAEIQNLTKVRMRPILRNIEKRQELQLLEQRN